MSRSINIVLAATLAASCAADGYYGVEFGAPVYETTTYHDDLYYRDNYGWYYQNGGWLWTPSPGHGPDHWNYEKYPWYYQPAPAPPPPPPAPPQREEPRERAPQAPSSPPPEEPAPRTDDAADRDPK